MDQPLQIHISSFGYHVSGLPEDHGEHGGGFVFDCRGLPNPGRMEAYQRLTGLDSAVKAYLDASDEVHEFLHHALRLVELTAKSFRDRRFTSLTVSFGCTGGQHRSVFCAEWMAEKLQQSGWAVVVDHIDKPDFT